MYTLCSRSFRFFHLFVLLALALSALVPTQTARASGVVRYVAPSARLAWWW